MTTRYSADEVRWMVNNYHAGTVDETLDAFEERFGRRPRKSSFVSKASNLGLKKDVTLKHIRWTPERIAWFREFVPGHMEREISAESERVFGHPMTDGQIGSAKSVFGVKSGTTGGRFEKGQSSWNKGKTWDEFMPPESQERSRTTQFKKGNLPHNAVDKPIGTERADKDGYVWVKVAERKIDPRSAHDNWKPKHRLIWERENGRPVPDDCMVVFVDGDRTNFDPENLALETKAEHAVIARHRLPYHDAESHEVARAVARMKSAKHAARKAVAS